MPFLAEERFPIPTTDLLTWMFDHCAPYDQDKPVCGSSLVYTVFYISLYFLEELQICTDARRYTLMRQTLPGRFHIDRPAAWSANSQQDFGELVLRGEIVSVCYRSMMCACLLIPTT